MVDVIELNQKKILCISAYKDFHLLYKVQISKLKILVTIQQSIRFYQESCIQSNKNLTTFFYVCPLKYTENCI